MPGPEDINPDDSGELENLDNEEEISPLFADDEEAEGLSSDLNEAFDDEPEIEPVAQKPAPEEMTAPEPPAPEPESTQPPAASGTGDEVEEVLDEVEELGNEPADEITDDAEGALDSAADESEEITQGTTDMAAQGVETLGETANAPVEGVSDAAHATEAQAFQDAADLKSQGDRLSPFEKGKADGEEMAGQAMGIVADAADTGSESIGFVTGATKTGVESVGNAVTSSEQQAVDMTEGAVDTVESADQEIESEATSEVGSVVDEAEDLVDEEPQSPNL